MSFACYPSTTIRSTEAWNAMRCNALLFHSLPKLLYILIKPMEMIAHFIEKNAIFIFTCFAIQLASIFNLLTLSDVCRIFMICSRLKHRT